MAVGIARTPVSGGWNGAATTQNTLIGLGDSITYRANITSGPSQQAMSTGFIPWASALLQGGMRWVNAGVTGNTTAQMLARYSTDVATAPGRFLHILGGGNDASTVTNDATAVSVAAAAITSLSAIVSLGLAEGRTVILGTPYPFATHGTYAKYCISIINRWVRSQASDRVLVADYYGAMVDAAGALRSGVLVADNIHPSAYGASLMGRVLQAAISAWLPTRGGLLSSSLYDSDNALCNGSMVGNFASGSSSFTASTGMTGTGPRGWTWRRGTGTAITATVSKQARSGSVPAADFARAAITLTGADGDSICLERILNMRLWSSGGTANAIRRFYVPATGAQYDVLVDGSFAVGSDPTGGWPTTIGATFTDGSATLMCVQPIQPGAILRSVVECNISSVATGTVQPYTDCYVRNAAGTTQARTYGLYWDATSGTMPAAAESGAGLVIESPEVLVPAGFDLSTVTSSAGPSFGLALYLAVSGSATATVDWGRATVRVR